MRMNERGIGMTGQKLNYKLDDHEAAAALAQGLENVELSMEPMEHILDFFSMETDNSKSARLAFMGLCHLVRDRISETRGRIAAYVGEIADANDV